MAKWWPFGRKKEEAPREAPRPEPTPAPAPEPTPTPAPAEGKKRGFFGRLKDKVRPRKKEEAPPAAPPTAPPAPPTAPPTPPEAPEAPPAEEEEGAPPAPPKPKERVYPPFLHVSADGVWVISETEWDGVMSGTLHGADVKAFIDAMEGEGGPDYDTAIPLIADAYGIPGGLINVGASEIRSVDY